MNLWKLLPTFLIDVEGILYLPLFILPCYLICMVMFIQLRRRPHVIAAPSNRKKEALAFGIFLLISLIATTVMLLTLGPRIGTVIPPLLLLSNLVYPLVFLVLAWMYKGRFSILLWSFASLAGAVHAISWSVWLMALARS